MPIRCRARQKVCCAPTRNNAEMGGQTMRFTGFAKAAVAHRLPTAFAEGSRSQVHALRRRGQQVTWNSPIFGFLHSLNIWIASGVGAARTRHLMFVKNAAASGDSAALPY